MDTYDHGSDENIATNRQVDLLVLQERPFLAERQVHRFAKPLEEEPTGIALQPGRSLCFERMKLGHRLMEQDE